MIKDRNIYKNNLIKLYEFKFDNGEITKNQFFSIKNFIENYPSEFVKEKINAFEAFLYLNENTIIPSFPDNFDKVFFEKLLKLLNLEIPIKISHGWNYLYFPKLVKKVKQTLNDTLLKNTFVNFFETALIPDFKNVAYNNFKKQNSKQIKELTANNVNFKKWINHSFHKNYKLGYYNVKSLLIKEGSLILEKALGKRNNPGFIKNNGKLYSRIAPYIKNNKIRDFKSLKLAIEEIKSSHFSCSKQREDFYRNSIDIILKYITDINDLPDNIEFSFWKRQPSAELFIGSKIDTCLSVSRGSFFCLLDYFLDFFTNIVIIKHNGEIIGLCYVFIVNDKQGNYYLLFDNIELTDSLKKVSFFSYEILNYFYDVTCKLGLKGFFIGMNYNDVILPPLSVEKLYLKKTGFDNLKKYYVDAFNGYGVPEGEVKVYKFLI